ncbi:MAG TPA: thymidine phosphorylase [Ignavibacteria bacterium]|jgi:pyrimidine-nucleoside phosphorylase
MNPVEIVRKKRHGHALSKDEIDFFIHYYVKGELPDYQVSALLMAIYFNGLNDEETRHFTNAYIDSGKRVSLKHIKKPSVDKHSTGGVGDKTSMILAPLIACFDVLVPMISGRGLGHTGGTLDKLESIPGFKVHLSVKEFVKNLEKLNVCMIGQTDELTPADRKIYALRDVTATVENIGLITASITSKKIAEGAEAIVYDVKAGNGSTLPDVKSAEKLARSLIKTSRDFGQKALAVLTEMDSPLGYSIGNWLEVKECVELMDPSLEKSALSKDLLEVTLFLAGAMLFVSGKADSIEKGIYLAGDKLANGECFNRFIKMVEKQGGNTRVIKKLSKYPKTKYSRKVTSNKKGYLSGINALKAGLASVNLGCGRMNVQDKIDYSAGIVLNKKIGDFVKKGEVLYYIYGRSKEKIKSAQNILSESVEIIDTKPEVKSKILEVIN